MTLFSNFLRKTRSRKYLVPVIFLSIASILIFASILRNIKNFPIPQTCVHEPQSTLQTSLTALNGGLGNKLFEIISLLGIARTLKRTAVVNVLNEQKVWYLVKLYSTYPKLITQLKFELISEDEILEKYNNHRGCCKFDNPRKFRNETKEHLFLIGSYYQSFKYFHHIRDEIRDWLTPNSNDTGEAEKLIPKAIHGNFKICVHSRRGDFKTDSVHEPTHPVFARLATDFLVSKYKNSGKNVSVVLLSNDAHFSHAVFQDKVDNKKVLSNQTKEYKQKLVITYPANSPNYAATLISNTTSSVDLAFSRSLCDVVLITAPSSTFGWWLGYLAKPSATVYYRNIEETEDLVKKEMNQQDFYPPDWVRLGTNSKGQVENVADKQRCNWKEIRGLSEKAEVDGEEKEHKRNMNPASREVEFIAYIVNNRIFLLQQRLRNSTTF